MGSELLGLAGSEHRLETTMVRREPQRHLGPCPEITRFPHLEKRQSAIQAVPIHVPRIVTVPPDVGELRGAQWPAYFVDPVRELLDLRQRCVLVP